MASTISEGETTDSQLSGRSPTQPRPFDWRNPEGRVGAFSFTGTNISNALYLTTIAVIFIIWLVVPAKYKKLIRGLKLKFIDKIRVYQIVPQLTNDF